MSRRAILNVVLTLICALLGGGLVKAMAVRAPEPVSVPSIQQTQSVAPRLVTFTVPNARTFATLTQRPLFSATRRPAAVIRETATETPPPSVRMTGVVAVGDSRQALVQIDGAPTEMIGTGTRIGQWRVLRITDTILTLKRGERTASYVLGDEPTVPQSGSATALRSSRTQPTASFDMSDQIDE